MKTSVWIASVAWDYPGLGGQDDAKLPIANVWFRVAYGTNYKGDVEVTRLRDIYEAQGIGFYGVIVPTGTDWAVQREQALAAIRLCRGLEFDVEPYGGYLGSEAGLQAWLESVLVPLRHTLDSSPNPADHGKDISLCYDPREQWLDGWEFGRAAHLSDSLAPMVYTGMYSGQGAWGDPVLAIRRARVQCPPDKVFRPILQTYSIDPMETMAAFHEAVRVGGHPILFRRGVTPMETWNAIVAIKEPVVPAPPEPPKEDIEMSSAEFTQVMQEIGSLRDWVQTRVRDPIIARIANLENVVAQLGGTSIPVTPPSEEVRYTVVGGDNASSIAAAKGISLQQLKDLNPGGPRSGDWNLIYPKESFRIR